MMVGLNQIEALVIKGVLERVMESKEFTSAFNQYEQKKIQLLFQNIERVLREFH